MKKTLLAWWSWTVDNVVPISMGAILGAAVAGGLVYREAKGRTIFGFALDEAWISAVAGVIAGALISWLMTWAYARKSERDVNTIIAKVDEVRRARAHASTFDIFLDIIHENPKLAKAAGAGLVRLYDALAATVPTPVSPSGAVPGSTAGSHAKP